VAGRGDDPILIASFLEADQVDRIRDAWAGDVLWAPELLPRPRYVSDHSGVAPELGPAEEREWTALLSRARIGFDFDWWQPARIPERCPNLQWVQATSAGIGGFLQRNGLDHAGFVVTTAAGIHAAPLTEFAVGAALFFIRRFPDLLDRQRRHSWVRYTTDSLRDRRVTVVGLGEIGRQVARTFAYLGTEVTGVGRPGGSSPELPGVTLTDTDHLDEVLPATDVLVLVTPLTAETTGLIDRRRLDRLPDGAVLVNIARGPVLDPAALSDVLRDGLPGGGRLGGVALDVTDPEPLPPESPLWDRPDVLISPHSASTVASENAALTGLFLDNLARWREGRPLRNRYRPELGY
jgi:glyoxylate/hydroxypyruvate reductase A